MICLLANNQRDERGTITQNFWPTGPIQQRTQAIFVQKSIWNKFANIQNSILGEFWPTQCNAGSDNAAFRWFPELLGIQIPFQLNNCFAKEGPDCFGSGLTVRHDVVESAVMVREWGTLGGQVSKVMLTFFWTPLLCGCSWRPLDCERGETSHNGLTLS